MRSSNPAQGYKKDCSKTYRTTDEEIFTADL